MKTSQALLQEYQKYVVIQEPLERQACAQQPCYSESEQPCYRHRYGEQVCSLLCSLLCSLPPAVA